MGTGGRRVVSLLLALLLAAGLSSAHAGAPRAALAAAGAPAQVRAAPDTSRAGLVGEAFSRIADNYFNPVDTAGMLGAAWDAAVASAAKAGNAAPTPRPDVSGDANAAYLRFDAAYRVLEAATAIDPTVLAYDAIRGITRFINNCHTGFLTQPQAAARRAMTEGGSLVGPGFLRQGKRPWTLIYVVPGGPADRAGLRVGDTLLAYDGDTADDAPLTHARTEGQTLTYTIQRPGEDATRDITVTFAPYRFPRIETRVIDGQVGYIRFFAWEGGAAQAQAIRDAIAGFEAQGVTGWVLDVRANGGGAPAPIADLFLPAGRYLRLVTRAGDSSPFTADGAGIMPMRPLAILIGRGSGSASEIVPEAIRQAGRAVLVGEHTPGCMAFTSDMRLSDGSVVAVTIGHALIGSNGEDLEGIGVQPDITAPQTVDELVRGEDPGLVAAVQYLEGAAALRSLVAVP